MTDPTPPTNLPSKIVDLDHDLGSLVDIASIAPRDSVAVAAWRAASIALHEQERLARGLSKPEEYHELLAALAEQCTPAELRGMAGGHLAAETYLRLGESMSPGRLGSILGGVADDRSALRFRLQELAEQRGWLVPQATCPPSPMRMVLERVRRSFGAVGARSFARAIDRGDWPTVGRQAAAAGITGPELAMIEADPDDMVAELFVLARALSRGGAA
ncbi:MAG: hypothetical protein IT455_20670 [Planctomycetes bacterium]|nr:hypothetical protein [Planctomycetota bacterium]